MDGEGVKGGKRFTNPFQCGRLLITEEGATTLYRGITASLIREVPSTAFDNFPNESRLYGPLFRGFIAV